jgi:hypothetical protein
MLEYTAYTNYPRAENDGKESIQKVAFCISPADFDVQ